MKTCNRCGRLLDEKDVFCPYCGQNVDELTSRSLYKDKSLITVAKVFMYIALVGLVLCVFGLLFALLGISAVDTPEVDFLIGPLVGYLIMIIILIIINSILIYKVNKKIKNNEPMSVGFKIVVLLFSNLITGIMLLLVETE